MHNSESVLENETHKFLWDFEIQTDNLISTRRPDVVIVNNNNNNNKTKKENLPNSGLGVPADHRVKLKESEKIDNYLDIARELKKKTWNMKVTMVPIVIGALDTVTKGFVQRLEDLEIRGRIEAKLQCC